MKSEIVMCAQIWTVNLLQVDINVVGLLVFDTIGKTDNSTVYHGNINISVQYTVDNDFQYQYCTIIF